jgi:putative NIF3 family GTP cyclohydrolase 1 type 2
VGGDGKDYVASAIAAGADTYVSGRLSYNVMEEAAELGINLVEAGHYHTEAPVLEVLSELITSIDLGLTVDIANSNMIEIV